MNPQDDRPSAAPGPRGLGRAVALLLLLALAPAASAQGKRHHHRRATPAAAPASDPVAAPAPGPTDDAAPADPGKHGDAKPGGGPGSKKGKEQTFDFTGFQLDAGMMTPQLLYFLDRAEEELDRASLKRRSFVPEMVKSIDQESL